MWIGRRNKKMKDMYKMKKETIEKIKWSIIFSFMLGGGMGFCLSFMLRDKR